MCNRACIQFATTRLLERDVRAKRVIEVGARDFNGSLRSAVERLGPSSYVGVDIEDGPGVDEVCDAEGLLDRFGRESFDLVLCTEVLEHVRNWRTVITNLKNLLAPGGVLLITTRSKGFGYHAFPYDYWRYELGDMEEILADLSIEDIEPDPIAPGVFVKARHSGQLVEKDLSTYRLHSMVVSRRCKDVNPLMVSLFLNGWRARRFVSRRLPVGVRSFLVEHSSRSATVGSRCESQPGSGAPGHG